MTGPLRPSTPPTSHDMAAPAAMSGGGITVGSLQPRVSGADSARRGRIERARALPNRALHVVLDPIRVMLSLLTIVSISRIHQHYAFIGSLRPGLILVAGASAIAILNRRSLAPEPMFRWWPSRVVLGLFVLACLSALFGISLGGSAKFIMDDFWKIVLCSFLLQVSIRSARDFYTYAWAYVIGGLLTSWMALFVFHLSAWTGSAALRLGTMYAFDGNDIVVILIVALALQILVYQTGGGLAKVMALVCMAGMGATLARSGSRGGFLAFAAFGMALLFLLDRVPVAKRLAFIGMVGLTLLLVAPRGYWEQMHTIVDPSKDYNITGQEGRIAIWKRGIGYMMDYPIFGIGIGNFDRAECTISTKARGAYDAGVKCTAPHNSYIQAGSELGVGGLVLWTWLVIGGAIAMVRLRRRLPVAWLQQDSERRFIYLAAQFLAVGLVGFAVGVFFLSFAYLDVTYILAAFMAALYNLADRKLKEDGLPGLYAPSARRAHGRARNPRSASSSAPVPNSIPA
jgi:O-antigen ligase